MSHTTDATTTKTADAVDAAVPPPPQRSSSAVAMEELQVRLDAAARQVETVTLLIERQEQQLGAMEQRAALVVDDWSVLDMCRAALTSDAARYTPADRDVIATAIAQYDDAREDWRALPHCKLLVALPLDVYVRHSPPSSQQQQDAAAAPQPLDGEAKAAQVTAFREGLEEAQEQLLVLQRVQQHETATHARLRATLAELLPQHRNSDSEEPLHHRFRRAAPVVHQHAPQQQHQQQVPPSSSSVVSADTKRMHAADTPSLPVVRQSLRVLGLRSQATALMDGSSSEARWTDALRIAESLRLRCAAKAVGDATDGAEHQAATSSSGSAAGTSVGPSWRAMVEQTDELAFAIRRAVGATNKSKREKGAAATASTTAASNGDSTAGSSAADGSGSATTTTAAPADESPQRAGTHDDDNDDDDSLARELAAKEETIKKLEADLSAANTATESEKHRADSAEAEAREAGARASEAEHKNVALQQDLDASRNEVADLRAQLGQVKGLLEETKAVVAEIQQAQRDAEDRHKQELADKDVLIDQLRKDKQAADDRVKSLSVLESAASKWKAREEELVATAESASSANASAQKALAEVQLELSKIQVRAARDQFIAQEAKARIDEIVAERKRDNARTADALKDVHADVEKLRQANKDEAARHAAETTQLKDDHRAATKQLEQEKEAVSDERDTLRVKLEAVEERLAATEEALRQSREQHQKHLQQQRNGSPRNGNSNRNGSPLASQQHGSGVFSMAASASSPLLRRVQTMPLSYYSPSKSRQNGKAAPPPPLTEAVTAEPSPDPQHHHQDRSSAPRTTEVVMLFDDDSRHNQRIESPSRVVPVPIPHSHSVTQYAALDAWQTKQLLQRWHMRDLDRPRM